MGGRRVPRFGDKRSLAARKSPEFPRRNAKTRWDQPAGLVQDGHVAVTKCMEAGGIEPPSRDIFTMPSTCVVANLFSRQLRPLATGYSANQLRTFFSFPRTQRDG